MTRSLGKLVKEFYNKRPQLHVALAWAETGSGGRTAIRIFDGQHKAAAQILLGVRNGSGPRCAPYGKHQRWDYPATGRL